ncbi:MAG: hypothetical protein MI717_04930 [Spirochaetales bacterium]|nr:hypothetical protein [Spirochaetales bacterium]
MSKIKSALELALERTAAVKTDKNAVRKDQATKRGQAIAAKYFSNPAEKISFEEEILRNEEEGAWVKEGILSTVLANLTLPRYESDMAKVPPLSKALEMLSTTAEQKESMSNLMMQVQDLFTQYLESLKQLDEGLRAQWEPRLRQKEAQLRQQTGQAVPLTADQDPEFTKVLSEELGRIDTQFGEVLTRGKEQIRQFLSE